MSYQQRDEIKTQVTLRYSDMDVNGHLNNAIYATLFEAGRVAYLEKYLRDLMPDHAGYVIVRLAIDFLAEAHYPGIAEISTRMEKIGGSSMTYQQEITLEGKLVAKAESICAMFDLNRRKAMRCPDNIRERLRALGAKA
jgi:acyl-CoA thioester hydrolase